MRDEKIAHSEALPSARRRLRSRNRIALIAGFASLALLAGASVVTLWSVNSSATPQPHSPEPGASARTPTVPTPAAETTGDAQPAEPQPKPAEPQPTLDITSPSSVTVLVNKRTPLNPITFSPSDLVWPNVPNTSGHPLRNEAAAALETMYTAASAAGVPFTIISGYRPYAMQEGLFNSYAQRDGVAAAERYSARPGFSEHQTGLAADIDDGSGCALQACFGQTAAGMWLRNNAHNYGFILRYHEGQEATVGFLYEPWHFRYVGTRVATEMANSGILNYEDYLGVAAAPTY